MIRKLVFTAATVLDYGCNQGGVVETGPCQRPGTQGHAVSACAFDVTEEAEVDAAVARIERETGPIAILVNNAGMQFRTDIGYRALAPRK